MSFCLALRLMCDSGVCGVALMTPARGRGRWAAWRTARRRGSSAGARRSGRSPSARRTPRRGSARRRTRWRTARAWRSTARRARAAAARPARRASPACRPRGGRRAGRRRTAAPRARGRRPVRRGARERVGGPELERGEAGRPAAVLRLEAVVGDDRAGDVGAVVAEVRDRVEVAVGDPQAQAAGGEVPVVLVGVRVEEYSCGDGVSTPRMSSFISGAASWPGTSTRRASLQRRAVGHGSRALSLRAVAPDRRVAVLTAIASPRGRTWTRAHSRNPRRAGQLALLEGGERLRLVLVDVEGRSSAS